MIAIRRRHVISLDYCGYPAWSNCDYPRSSRLEHTCTQRCQFQIFQRYSSRILLKLITANHIVYVSHKFYFIFNQIIFFSLLSTYEYVYNTTIFSDINDSILSILSNKYAFCLSFSKVKISNMTLNFYLRIYF